MNTYFYNKTLESNINFLLNLNKGKKVLVCATFKELSQEFNGIIEKTTTDTLIISNPESGHWYLIPTKYINYIEFYENITFEAKYN